MITYLSKNNVWLYPCNPAEWYLLQPGEQETPLEISMITENMTRRQALEEARDALGTQWRDPVSCVRYKTGAMNAHRLVVFNVETKQMALRCGELSTLTDTKIAMVKILTLKYKLRQELSGRVVALELILMAIRAMGERFKEV